MPFQPRLTFEAPTPDPTLAAVLKMAERLDAVARDLAVLRETVGHQRREIKDGVKRQRVQAIGVLGGRCPCCGSREVVAKDGKKAENAEQDHFYAASKPDVDRVWLVCRVCQAVYRPHVRSDRQG